MTSAGILLDVDAQTVNVKDLQNRLYILVLRVYHNSVFSTSIDVGDDNLSYVGQFNEAADYSDPLRCATHSLDSGFKKRFHLACEFSFWVHVRVIVPPPTKKVCDA